MNSPMVPKAFIGIAALQAAFYLAFAVGLFLGMEDDVNRLNGLIPLGIVAAIAVGLWLHRERPVPGGILALVAVVFAGVLTFWTIFTPILAVLTLALWFASWRGRRVLEPDRITG